MPLRTANWMMAVGVGAVAAGTVAVFARWTYPPLARLAPTLLPVAAAAVPIGTVVLAVGAAVSAWTLWHQPAARTRGNVRALWLGGPLAVMLTVGMVQVATQLAWAYLRAR